MESAFGSRKLAQVAIVVKDMDVAVARWAQVLGVEPPKVVTTAPGGDVRATYRGESTDDRAKLAFFDLGGVQLELIEPIGQNSAWYEGLAARGEGVHHLAFWTENAAENAKSLAESGIPVVHRGDMGDGQYVYFDAQEHLGTMIELLEHKRTPIT